MGKLQKVKKTLGTLLKFLFAGAIVFLLIKSGKLDLVAVKKSLFNLNLSLPIFLLFFANIAITAFRWQLLLKPFEIELPYIKALSQTFIGLFFNTTLPGMVTGDVVKAYYLIKHDGGKAKIGAVTSVLLDRIIGLCGLISLAGFALFYAFLLGDVGEGLAFNSLRASIAALFAGVLFFYFVMMIRYKSEETDIIRKIILLIPFFSKHIIKMYDSVRMYNKFPKIVIYTFLLSLVVHVINIEAFHMVARALGETHLDKLNLFLIVPLGMIAIALPISPAGIGVGHAAFFALFKIIGSDKGADIFTVFIMFSIILNLLGGVFYVLYKKETITNEEDLANV